MTKAQQDRSLIVVAGPTASGKSALALAIAEAFGGTVINADSMQVYRELSVLTARPDPDALARAPHRLYGVLAGGDSGVRHASKTSSRSGVAATRRRDVERVAAQYSGESCLVATGRAPRSCWD